MLVLSSEMTAVNSFNMPARSSQETVILTGSAAGGRRGLVADARPLDGDAAVALVEQVLHVGTTARVDGDALAAGDVADDLFAANGVATARAIDEQVVLALDLERVRAGEVQLAHRVGHGRFAGCRAWLLGGGLGSAWLVEPGASLLSTWRAECLPWPRAASRSAAVATPYSLAMRPRSWSRSGERHLVLARLALQQLAADLDGAAALVFVEPVLDLVAGAGTLDEGEPVAAGLVILSG
jgi:hypothetical protein